MKHGRMRRVDGSAGRRVGSLLAAGALVGAWQLAIALNPRSLIPGPWPVVLGLFEL